MELSPILLFVDDDSFINAVLLSYCELLYLYWTNWNYVEKKTTSCFELDYGLATYDVNYDYSSL